METFQSHLSREKVDSVKNNFSVAGTLMCVTRERYGIRQSDFTTLCTKDRTS